jgi:isopropylmalate/homocitrate/citramalate synthase
MRIAKSGLERKEVMIGHLTQEEFEQIQAAVKRCRTDETLVRGKWSVSPLNRDPNALGVRPSYVKLRDISLRTIEQTPGVWLSPKQRQSLTETLVDAGVRSFQVAWLVFKDAKSLETEVAFLKSLADDIETSVTAATHEQADMAAQAGVDVYSSYAPSIWEFNMIYGTYGRLILRANSRGENWRKTVKYPRSEAEQLDMLASDVQYAQSLGMKGCMASSMLHYATIDYLRKFGKTAQDVGADEIRLNDGASGLAPEAWRYLVSNVREVAPDVPISTHTHNAYGLASANALAAVSAGATGVEVAVNHVCGATGQADLAEVAAALEVLYGVNTGIKLGNLTHLARFVEDLTGAPLAANHPITGVRAFEYAEEAMAEEELYAPVHKSVNPELFGNEAYWVLGRNSGVDASYQLDNSLREKGIELSSEELSSVLERLKRDMESRGRAVTPKELADEALYIISSTSRLAGSSSDSK